MNDQEKLVFSTLETLKHVKEVAKNINLLVADLQLRAINHDNSKFESPEAEIFAANVEGLAKTEYGTQEYRNLAEKVKPAIQHHYAKNRHHPEHHKNGMDDFTLVDLVEMLSDWTAATARNKNGNIRKSIEINAERYSMPPMLRKILENTVKEYFG